MTNFIAIRTASSSDAVRLLEKIIHKSWSLVEVRMDYNTNKLPDYDRPETYPVTVIFSDGDRPLAVKIAALSAGYGGTGPHYFQRLLDYFNLDYNEDDFFTKKKVDSDGFIRLSYVPH